jgi:class 3 adenylate cyclase
MERASVPAVTPYPAGVQMKRPEAPAMPEEPALAAVAAALRDAGHWAEIVDRDWRLVYSTEDLRRIYGGLTDLAPVALGTHYFGPEAMRVRLHWRSGPNTLDLVREMFTVFGGLILADTAGGRDELRTLVDPALRDLVDQVSVVDPSPAHSFVWRGTHVGTPVDAVTTAMRVHDAGGRHIGAALIFKPGAGMAVLATVAVGVDQRHFERMQTVAKAARRPAAVLFADLEASSPLARRLPTAGYFAFGRRLARAADRCIIDAGGLVGRHVGDGVVAFFLAETAGSESAAARACIVAARALRSALAGVATQSNLTAEEVVLRFGLHWGSTLYVGQIATSGRTEVIALGDEVNETARIEACATGGRAFASKALVERLAPGDAAELGLDPDRATYTPLADLATATEKARRDAPAIAVCEV